VVLPSRDQASVVDQSESFLSHDTATLVDPYAVSTRGTTNGYTWDPDRDVRRTRGHAHAGIYLDQVAPRVHEQVAVHDGPAVRTGALANERADQGRTVAATASDFYTGATHGNPQRNSREPRRMDERFMTKVDKYDARDRKLAVEVEQGRAQTTQLEEEAHRRASQRNDDKLYRHAAEHYDPWTVAGGDMDPHFHRGITAGGQMDAGRLADIPQVQMRASDRGVPDDPYRDMGAKRVVLEDRGVLGGGASAVATGPEGEAAANYATKWYGAAAHPHPSTNFRRMRDEDAPTNALSHSEMVRMRFKHEKEGVYKPIEGRRRMHVMEKHGHYTDAGVGDGPPILAGIELNHPQAQRGKREYVNTLTPLRPPPFPCPPLPSPCALNCK
jgi:hypothetical protein